MSDSAEAPAIKHVLVAVDGSESATKALKFATQIARRTRAQLTILNVLTLPRAGYSGDMPYLLDEIEKDARLDAEKILQSAASLALQGGVKAKTAIEDAADSPVRAITGYADKNKVDLIVVGTRGLGGFKRLLLGSVASGVVHYAHCSVSVVR